jgi:hypothetical protein
VTKVHEVLNDATYPANGGFHSYLLDVGNRWTIAVQSSCLVAA